MTEAAQANGTTLANGAVRVAAARLDAVSKLYGGFAALRKVTVEFAAGSSTVVLGENGAGKSTLLRLVAGLIAPTRGTVHVFGDEPRWQRRRIAYMSHEAMLYDELSAMENLRYFARLHGGCACVRAGAGAASGGTGPGADAAGGAILAGNEAEGCRWRGCCRRTRSCCCWMSRSRIWTWIRRSTWWSC